MRLSVKTISLLSLVACSVFSCRKDERQLSPEEIGKRVDSIVKIKEETLRKEAQEDLNRRLSIEVKPKVDSILKHTAEPDTVLPALDTLISE